MAGIMRAGEGGRLSPDEEISKSALAHCNSIGLPAFITLLNCGARSSMANRVCLGRARSSDIYPGALGTRGRTPLPQEKRTARVLYRDLVVPGKLLLDLPDHVLLRRHIPGRLSAHTVGLQPHPRALLRTLWFFNCTHSKDIRKSTRSAPG